MRFELLGRARHRRRAQGRDQSPAELVEAPTRDLRKVSLWLGHTSTQTTDIYLQADPTEKLEALAAMKPPMLRPGKFRPPDRLIAALRAPAVMRTSKATNP